MVIVIDGKNDLTHVVNVVKVVDSEDDGKIFGVELNSDFSYMWS